MKQVKPVACSLGIFAIVTEELPRVSHQDLFLMVMGFLFQRGRIL